MSKVAHVSGTWRAYESAGFKGEWGVETDDPAMGEMGDEIIVYPSLSEEHARLIAAAPDMFEAIKAFLPCKISSGNRSVPDDIVIPLDVTMGELRALEAAIAKAEGRQP